MFSPWRQRAWPLCPVYIFFFLSLVSHTSGQYCPVGTYGLDCARTCHCYLGNWECDQYGHCAESDECSRGWTGAPSCQKECEPGTFGLRCQKLCHCPPHDECDPMNGLCRSGVCAAGWGGSSCQTILPVLSSPPKVTAFDQYSVTLAWKAWSPNQNYDNQNTEVKGYILEYSSPANDIKWTQLAEMQPIPHSGNWYKHVVSSLQPGSEYRFRLSLVWIQDGKRKVSRAGPMVVATTAEQEEWNILVEPPNTVPSTASTSVLTSKNSKLGSSKTAPESSRTAPGSSKTAPGSSTMSTTAVPLKEEKAVVKSRNMTSLFIQLAGEMQYQCYLQVMYNISKSYTDHVNKSQTLEREMKDCHWIKLHNLHPATQYRIAVFAQSKGWKHLGYFWTLQEMPPTPPKPTVVTIKNDSIVLTLKPVRAFLGPVSAYHLTVEHVKLMTNVSHYQRTSPSPNSTSKAFNKVTEGKPSDILMDDKLMGVQSRVVKDNSEGKETTEEYAEPMILARIYRSVHVEREVNLEGNDIDIQKPKSEPQDIYSSYQTAKLLPREISRGVNFTVGDRKVYNKVKNKPLIPGNKYNIQYCVVSSLDGHKAERCSSVESLVTLTAMPVPGEKNSGPASDGVIAAVFFVVVALVVLVSFLGVRFLKRKKARQEEQGIGIAFTPNFAESVVTSTPIKGRYESTQYAEVDEADELKLTHSKLNPNKLDYNAKADYLYSVPKKLKKTVKYQEADDVVQSQPISVQELRHHCQAEAGDMSGPPLLAEFERLQIGPFGSWEAAQSMINEPYNRTQEIVPYNHNRVKVTEGQQHVSDYINASWVTPHKEGKQYIVTQHPLLDSMGDFWQMIWEHDISLLVLLTDISCENSTLAEPFEPFWPEGEPCVYRDVTVTPTQKETLANYSIHALELNCLGVEENRIVELFYFNAWNEDNVPLHVVCFIQFYQRIKKVTESTDKTAVICETGSVKSGLYVAIDSLTQDGLRDEQVDVFTCVQCLRESRVGLVDSLDQYEFIYCFLIEFFCEANKRFSSAQLKIATTSHVVKFHTQKEFKGILYHRGNSNMASSLYYQGSQESLSSSLRKFLTSPAKKRQQLYSLPVNTCFQDDQLIVAPSLSSYAVKDLFVLIRAPLEAQFGELWDIVLESQATMIVLLHEDGLDQFWPQKGYQEMYNAHEVENLQVKTSEGFTQHHLSVKADQMTAAGGEDLLTLHQLTAWAATASLPALPTFLSFLKAAMQIWVETGRTDKVMIVCEEGQQRAGLFCLMWSLLEMLQSDGTVGVYHETRRLQDQIPNFHIDLDMYKFCYRLLEEHVCGPRRQAQPASCAGEDASVLDDTSVIVVEDLC